MALSLRGRELWPPGFVTSRRKLIGTFSLVCRRFTVCRPPRISPPPPSLIASSASISPRWLARSQRTPLYFELEPSSSSAVSARMMSRVGLEALALEPDQRVHEDRGHRLVVAGAAPVEVAVLLHQRERVGGPVLAARLDHVEVGQQQQRLARPRPPEARHQVALARRRRQHLDVVGREAGRAQAGRHGLGGPGVVADRVASC